MTPNLQPNLPALATIAHFYQTLPGYFSFPDFYTWLANEFPSGHGVEVGSYAGCSAAYLAVELHNAHAARLQDANGSTRPRLDLVDTFTDGGSVDQVRHSLAPVAHIIGAMHACQSWDGAARYEDGSLDYVYIDADHRYEAVKRDIAAWLPKVKVGGIIAGHDFWTYPGFGVIEAVMERFERVEIWRGIRFDGDGVRTSSAFGDGSLGVYYPTWAVRVQAPSQASIQAPVLAPAPVPAPAPQAPQRDPLMKPELVVIDNFFSDPDAIRAFALQQTYAKNGSAGLRSTETFRNLVDPSIFEDLLRRKLASPWDHYPINGRFQFCTAEDQIVYHSDAQSHAGIIFLTPNAPVEAGLTLVKSKLTGARQPSEDAHPDVTYEGNLLDSTKWEPVDKIGNIYNRLVLWNGRLNHAASCYFGTTIENSRLFQMFFFDAA